MRFLILQTFNGLSYGAIIFLLASGLSIIFGVMDIVNMAHASFYLLGGYVGLTIMWYTGNFYLALAAGIAVVPGYRIHTRGIWSSGSRSGGVFPLRFGWQPIVTAGFL